MSRKVPEKKQDTKHDVLEALTRLLQHAEDQKYKLAHGTPEQQYWQGVADTCRKSIAVWGVDISLTSSKVTEVVNTSMANTVIVSDFELRVLRIIADYSKRLPLGKGLVRYVAAARRLEKKGLVVKGSDWCATGMGREYLKLMDAQEKRE